MIALALAGLGKIARDQHLPALAASDDFTLDATIDPRGQGIAGIPHFATLAAMRAALPRVSALAVCTPPQVRAETRGAGTLGRPSRDAGEATCRERLAGARARRSCRRARCDALRRMALAHGRRGRCGAGVASGQGAPQRQRDLARGRAAMAPRTGLDLGARRARRVRSRNQRTLHAHRHPARPRGPRCRTARVSRQPRGADRRPARAAWHRGCADQRRFRFPPGGRADLADRRRNGCRQARPSRQGARTSPFRKA